MVTCVNDAMFPATGQATVTLLRRLGVSVEFPEQQACCGQPMVNTGYLDEAVPVVRNCVAAFEGYDAVVVPSGSCAGSVRHQHSMVARRAGDPSLGALGPRTYELTEFLVDVLGVTDVGASFPHRVTYHPTCHSLRMLGVGDRPLSLLRSVRGLRAAPSGQGGGVLRVRRHVRDQERRHLGGDGVGQGTRGGQHRRGGARRRRLLVPDAHRGTAVPAAQRRAGHAPRGGPGLRQEGLS